MGKSGERPRHIPFHIYPTQKKLFFKVQISLFSEPAKYLNLSLLPIDLDYGNKK